MARVLILRQREEAERTAVLIRERGHHPLILATEEAMPTNAPPPAGEWAGFAATSANALPALLQHFGGDARPLLCVGEGTARAAGDSGFANILVGDGRAAGLAPLAARIAAESGGALLYAAGRPRTGTLEAALDAQGIAFTVWETYAVGPLHFDEAAAREALEDGAPPDAVLVLSVGQALACGQLWDAAPGVFAGTPLILCLSERIAAALPDPLAKNALISQEPRLLSLFDRLPPPSFVR